MTSIFIRCLGVPQRSFHAKCFHAASLNFQVIIKIAEQFRGFSKQHQGKERRITREVLQIFAGKISNFEE